MFDDRCIGPRPLQPRTNIVDLASVTGSIQNQLIYIITVKCNNFCNGIHHKRIVIYMYLSRISWISNSQCLSIFELIYGFGLMNTCNSMLYVNTLTKLQYSFINLFINTGWGRKLCAFPGLSSLNKANCTHIVPGWVKITLITKINLQE